MCWTKLDVSVEAGFQSVPTDICHSGTGCRVYIVVSFEYFHVDVQITVCTACYGLNQVDPGNVKPLGTFVPGVFNQTWEGFKFSSVHGASNHPAIHPVHRVNNRWAPSSQKISPKASVLGQKIAAGPLVFW